MRKLPMHIPALVVALLAILAMGVLCPTFAQSQGGGTPTPTIPVGIPGVMFFPDYPTHNGPQGGVGSLVYLNARALSDNSTWTISSNHTVNIYLLSINQETQPPVCSGALLDSVALSTSNSGSFSTNFIWPTTLTRSAGPLYVACLHEQGVSGAQDFYSAYPANAINNSGVFNVLTDVPATLYVSPSVVNPGDTITVTGQNWAPSYGDADDYITVSVGTCTGNGAIGSKNNILPDGNYTFTATFTLPTNTQLGNYRACANTYNTSQRVDTTSAVSAPTFQVAFPQTATTVPTVTPLTTTTTAPTATTAAAGASTTANSNTTNTPGSSDNSVLIAVIIALIAMLALGGALLYFFLSRHGNAPPPPDIGGSPKIGESPPSPDWGANTQPDFDQIATGKQPAPWRQPALLPPDENTRQGPPVIWE